MIFVKTGEMDKIALLKRTQTTTMVNQRRQALVKIKT